MRTQSSPGPARRTVSATARLFQAPVGRQVCPGRRHMRSGSNAERRGVSEGARQRRVLLLGRRVRLDPTDEIERLILEDPDGLAGLWVAQDLTARWRGGVLGDAGYFHGSGVRERLVAVQPTDEDGVAGRHRIDPFVPRQRLARPKRVVPITTGDPFPGLDGSRVLPETPDEFLGRRGVSQIDRRELEPAANEVRVAVCETGDHQPAVRVNHLGARADVAGDRGRVADREDLARRDRHDARLRSARGEAGPYHTAADDDFRRPAARGERNAQQSHLNVSAHAVLSAEFGDAADRLQRSGWVGAGALPSASFSDGGRDGEGVADVEQHLEQELLALVGSVDIGHPRLVAGGLGAIVGFAVDRFEIAEDPLTGPWTHGGERYSLAT